MSLIKQLFPPSLKFSPADASVDWPRVETLVHGPGASGTLVKDSNSAVFACLMAIATAYPEPPLTVYRKASSGNDKKLVDSPLQAILDRPTPNGELSMDEILFWTAWAKHVDGNAYWLKVRSGNAESGNVIELWPVSPI
jgi:phage portal protein BeeE